MHFDRDGIPGCDRTLPRNPLRATDVAPHIGGPDVGDGGIRPRHSNTSACLVHAIHPELLEDGMRGCLLDSQSGKEDECLHGCESHGRKSAWPAWSSEQNDPIGASTSLYLFSDLIRTCRHVCSPNNQAFSYLIPYRQSNGAAELPQVHLHKHDTSNQKHARYWRNTPAAATI